jgi:carboxyl-terminal processing protease
VLVDRFSASAAEILAGALQDYGRALIVGTGPTHGKGTVQAVADLESVVGPMEGQPLGVMKLTIQQFFLVDGESTQWRGVQPDVVLPDPASHVESGERYLDNAIPFSQVAPLPATPSPHEWKAATLAEESKARQQHEPVFAQITHRGEYLEERRHDTLLPLKREAWVAQREKDRETLDTLDPKLEDGPARFEVKPLEYRSDAPPVAAVKTGDSQPATRVIKADGKREVKWEDTLARDPWVEEALRLLAEMAAGNVASKAPNAKAQ